MSGKRLIINGQTMLSDMNEYSIIIGANHGWHLIATQREKELLQQMAFIMELSRCESNSYPKLIFTSYDSNMDECLNIIAASYPQPIMHRPENSWKIYRSPFLHIWYHSDFSDVICKVLPGLNRERKIVAMCQALYPVYSKVMNSGGLPLHSALIEREGRGILLVGSGETGKSTCCRRIPLPWQPLCDDETLFVLNGIRQYLIHPFPTWGNCLVNGSGQKTWNVQRHLRVAAIFFLEQAGKDEVKPMGQGEAAVGLNRSALQIFERYLRHVTPEEAKEIRLKIIENAGQFSRAIPAYTLRFTRRGAFWEEIERVVPISETSPEPMVS
jgi:SynChlorMet cassette protein ScmC